ncbi:FMN-binding protein [Streptomyces durhamensis]|uniref:FMN-binding protein n=1 Tax=Streptomyces durhamensis TaxID=68194 RepID=UPI00068DCC71|nr:FMN-binding protein [Streptomyces durhamensis]
MHALKKSRPLRRIVLAGAATVSGMVLLLSLKPHTAPTPASASAKPPAASGGSSPSAGSTAGAEEAFGSATGDTVQTRWGPVQVRVTVQGGRLTDVTAVQYPQDNPRDQEINGYALPQLRREALAAQSARIDAVSGATYTSDG